MRPGFEKQVPYTRNVSANPWLPDYPNPPDLRFNYFKLLNDAWSAGTAIGKAPSAGKSVCVIGGGAAGMTAARELWRSGYQVSIMEASPRVGGRLYTQRRQSSYFTAYEFGAMRMPFFNDEAHGESPSVSTNSILSYYLNKDQQWSGNPAKTFAILSDFPNPGQSSGGTGIYMNNGYGPNDTYSVPTLIPWPNGGQPQNADLQRVSAKVDALISLFTKVVAPVYTDDSPAWDKLWQQIANNYDKMSFSDLVFTDAITQYKGDGWFGGFGMDAYESELFYTIGVGDGSWGAFYSISAMWFIRCVMFGYSSDLQTVSGLNNASYLPMYNATPRDTNGSPMEPPFYRGIQSLVELLFYLRAPGAATSLYSAVQDKNDYSAEMYVNTPVRKLKRNANGTIDVYLKEYSFAYAAFDHVIITAPIWSTQLSIEFEGFDNQTMLPWQVPAAIQQQHLIASAKVFFPLYKAYWNQPNDAIPQLIVTDTFVQDAYGLQWGTNDNDAAILASYTWEDDAAKLVSVDDATLKRKVLAELERVTTSTLKKSISNYIDANAGVVFQWSLQPTYHGCAKLYRQRSWEQCYDLLAYNQQYSNASRLYFAGESYGVEGGWTEPALRTALDAVIHVINNSKGTFNNEFTFSNYPRYDVNFSPNENYPQL